MSQITPDIVKKIAHLARLNLSEDEIKQYAPQLSSILDLVEQMSQVNTDNVEPLSHPLDVYQRTRPDAVTEPDLRSKYQGIAPRVEAGLYLVPKVIEEA